jgi:hypothetical protein
MHPSVDRPRDVVSAELSRCDQRAAIATATLTRMDDELRLALRAKQRERRASADNADAEAEQHRVRAADFDRRAAAVVSELDALGRVTLAALAAHGSRGGRNVRQRIKGVLGGVTTRRVDGWPLGDPPPTWDHDPIYTRSILRPDGKVVSPFSREATPLLEWITGEIAATRYSSRMSSQSMYSVDLTRGTADDQATMAHALRLTRRRIIETFARILDDAGVGSVP